MRADTPLDPRFLDDHDNRSGGPEWVIDLVEDWAPGGFIDFERVASQDGRSRSRSEPAAHPQRGPAR